MTEKIEYSMVLIKMADLVSYIAKKKRMTMLDAMCYLYNSDFVAKLYDEEAKWWYLDNETLYGIIEQNRNDESANLSSQESQFVVFCVEQYARRNHLSGLEVFALFKRSGLIWFLKENFEVLHTQGEAYILEEIALFLKKRRQV